MTFTTPTTVPLAARVLRLPEVEEMTGLRRSRISDLVKSGAFPAPIRLSARAVAWRGRELLAWLDSRPRVGVPTPSSGRSGCPVPDETRAVLDSVDRAMALTTAALDAHRAAREVPPGPEQIAALERVGAAIQEALDAWREAQGNA